MTDRAALLTVAILAACGDPDPVFVDAGPIDAAPVVDGAVPLATVTVHVRRLAGDGAPDPSATVFFIDPDGRIADQRQPDATGTAVGRLVAAGGVTVGWPGTPLTLSTVLAVEDGDDLTFGPDDRALDQQVTVTLPVRAGADLYWVAGPCLEGSTGAATVVIDFGRGCGPTRSLLATARSGNTLSYLVAPAVTPVDGGAIAVTGAWVAGTTARVDFTGLPIGASGLYPRRQLMVAGAATYRTGLNVVPITAGTASASFNAPVGYGDGALLHLSYVIAGSSSWYDVRMLRPTTTETAPIDVAPRLPDLTSASKSGPTVTWSLDRAGAFDAVVIDLDEYTATEELLTRWRVVTAPTAIAATLPTLPAPFDGSRVGLGAVRLIDSSVIDGHAAFRGRAGTGDWIDDLPLPAPADAWLASRIRS